MSSNQYGFLSLKIIKKVLWPKGRSAGSRPSSKQMHRLTFSILRFILWAYYYNLGWAVHGWRALSTWYQKDDASIKKAHRSRFRIDNLWTLNPEPCTNHFWYNKGGVRLCIVWLWYQIPLAYWSLVLSATLYTSPAKNQESRKQKKIDP